MSKKSQRKVMILVGILLLAIGYAAVTTTLYLNGDVEVEANNSNFDVYFSAAYENGVENKELIQDKTHIVFETTLSKLSEKYVLDYEVTNASKQYDANLTINCSGGNEFLRVSNDFDISTALAAKKTRNGRLTLTVIRSVMEEKTVSIECQIVGTAAERTIVGEEKNYLVVNDPETNEEKTISFLSGEIKDGIDTVTKITFVDSKDIPTAASSSWDVSSNQNQSIMAWMIESDEGTELFIGQDDGVIANPDSSRLFDGMTSLKEISGLENFNTKYVTDMSFMFSNCTLLETLDVSHFNTRNVTTMYGMFAGCSSLKSIDLSSFRTENVVDMSWMFNGCALVSLNLSSFNTTKVKRMNYMFSDCTNLINLNLSTFNTVSVESMEGLFSNSRRIKTEVTIRGNLCTNYIAMFEGTSTSLGSSITVNYTEDASSLVDFMIATKSDTSNIVKGSVVS